MPDDAQLLEAYARRGDVESLSALVSRHAVWLKALLRGLLPGASDAEDAFQEVWVRVIQSAGTYRGGSVRAYLARIARSAVVDRHRRELPTVSLDIPAEDGETPLEDLPDERPGTVGELAARASAEEIRNAVRDLPPGPRQVLLLRVEAGLSFNEIADQLGVPMGTALGWMRAASAQMRKRLGRWT